VHLKKKASKQSVQTSTTTGATVSNKTSIKLGIKEKAGNGQKYSKRIQIQMVRRDAAANADSGLNQHP